MKKHLPKRSTDTRFPEFADNYVLCKAALSVIDEGIHIINQNGVSVFYNIAMANLEGLAPSEVIGLPLDEVFPQLTSETSTLLKVVETKQPIYDHIQTYYTLRGASITTINSTIPILVNGKCVGAVEIAKDFNRVERLGQAMRKIYHDSDAFPFEETNCKNGTVYSFHHMVGKSRSLLKARELAEAASTNEHPVIIYGETGVGKEVFSQSIHNASRRAAKPFVAVNCATLPEALLESTLFGTVRGAFTGALDKHGLFEEAKDGTLFLDELDSMSLPLQAKLLRALEEKAIRRVGSTRLIPTNLRIIASTGVDPLDAVEEKQLRQDLYFRLAINIIRVPPLRERDDDLVLLAKTFSRRYSLATGNSMPIFDATTLDLFRSYSWPGNVRELKHVVLAISGTCKGHVTVSDLPEHFMRAVKRNSPAGPAWDDGLKALLEHTEIDMIKSSLESTDTNIAAAARLLGISRQSLQYKLRKYNIKADI